MYRTRTNTNKYSQEEITQEFFMGRGGGRKLLVLIGKGKACLMNSAGLLILRECEVRYT